MPESWLNMAIATASRIGLRYFALEQRVAPLVMLQVERRAGSRRPPGRCRAPSTPSLARTARASSTRPRPMSQRGLSGVGNRRRKNAAEGTAWMPSIHRHSAAPRFIRAIR